jgi:hypothetical protein
VAVHTVLAGRLGNNLFQYAFGRIVAEGAGTSLYVTRRGPPVRTAVETGSGAIVTLESEQHLFADVRLVEWPESAEAPEWALSVSTPPSDGHTIDRDAVCELARSHKPVQLAGYFQREEYYADRRDFLQRCFRLTGNRHLPAPGARDVLVNIRRGTDYEELGWVLPSSYYNTALGAMTDIGRVWVCGVGLDTSVRATLARFRPLYCETSAIEQFGFMQRFRRVVLSNSTFAWWAVWLSEVAEEVISPHSAVPHVYAFGGYTRVDLRMSHLRYRPILFNFAESCVGWLDGAHIRMEGRHVKA